MYFFATWRKRFLVALEVFIIFVTPICWAQQKAQPTDQTNSSVTARIDALEAGQRQMLQELKLLEDKIQPPAVPTSMKIDSEPSIGERSAPVAIVEFADFECPFCAKFERDTYPQVLENYIKTGKAVFFYHDLPLSAHRDAESAAEAARCAEDQNKYWEMHDALFAHQNALSPPAITSYAQSLGMDASKFTTCISTDRYADAIQQSAQYAEQIGVRGTPSFFIGTLDADGHELKIVRALRGAYTYDAFRAALDGVLAQTTADKPDNKQ